MKVAVVYNRESKNVINLFGQPNKEHYGLQAIKRITDSLKKGGHQPRSFEADKTLIDQLGNFMPSVVKGERPGMVFNLSYGVQGQARYTHVPSILEMVGVPYVGSGPLAHSLALDKVVAKMLFVQNGLPTPKFSVVDTPDQEILEIPFPVIVKPKNESTSFGLRVCKDAKELREGIETILREFNQPVLVEQYIDGRELNVGILGNDPVEALQPAEIIFGGSGPKIYTLEDKKRESGREIDFQCPAKIPADVAKRAQEISIKAFKALGCVDCARVDLRMDKGGDLYILEINSLPSLGEHGSYTQAAEQAGLRFSDLVNRLVDVASARYFGTPTPPEIKPSLKQKPQVAFDFIVQRRDRMEKRLEDWVSHQSYTDDPIGIQAAYGKLQKTFSSLKLKEIPTRETDNPFAKLWETKSGLKDGTLILLNLDVPVGQSTHTFFRADPEWLYGEAIARSRGPLVSCEYALRALKATGALEQTKLGVMVIADEGLDCRESAELVKKYSELSKRVLVLRPGILPDAVVVSRRGYKKYRLVVEDTHRPFGFFQKRADPFTWTNDRIAKIIKLSDKKSRLALGVVDLKTSCYPVSFPHRIEALLHVSYADEKQLTTIEDKIEKIFKAKPNLPFKLHPSSGRPPMKKTTKGEALHKAITAIGKSVDVEIGKETSALPSVAGLVSHKKPVICGLGPIGKDLYSPNEAIKRISLVQRTLILAESLLEFSKE